MDASASVVNTDVVCCSKLGAEYVLVYRIEHNSKRRHGPYRRKSWVPYRHRQVAEWLALRHSNDDHPVPEEENDWKGTGIRKVDYFGFISEARLKDWFCPEERKALAENKFILAIYKVAKKHISFRGQVSGQVAFYRAKSVLVEKRNLVTLEPIENFS